MLQRAEKWSARRKLSADISLLWEPHLQSFLRCKIGHIRGRDRDLLIDSRPGSVSQRNRTRIAEDPGTGLKDSLYILG